MGHFGNSHHITFIKERENSHFVLPADLSSRQFGEFESSFVNLNLWLDFT